jgi:hypothetical protein
MLSRHKSPLDLSDDSFSSIRERLAVLSNATLPSAFSRIITGSLVATVNKEDTLLLTIRLRNTCQRPKVIYNKRYDPFKTPPADLDP